MAVQRITQLLGYGAKSINPLGDHIGILGNKPIRDVGTDLLPEWILGIVQREGACRLESLHPASFWFRLLQHPPALCYEGVLMTGQGLAYDRDILSVSTEQPVLQIGQLRLVYREQSQSGI